MSAVRSPSSCAKRVLVDLSQEVEVLDERHEICEPLARAAGVLSGAARQPLCGHEFVERSVSSVRIEIDGLEHQARPDVGVDLSEQAGSALAVDRQSIARTLESCPGLSKLVGRHRLEKIFAGQLQVSEERFLQRESGLDRTHKTLTGTEPLGHPKYRISWDTFVARSTGC